MREHEGTMADEHDNFLPNFCSVTEVFLVVVGAELLAFVLTLVQPGGGGWALLGLVSLYVQWVALGSAALLCLGRPYLERLGDVPCSLASFTLILTVTAVVGLTVELGLRGARWETVDWAWFLRSLMAASIIASVVLRYLYIQHHWRRRIQGAAAARIDALQARIRPHFLFNSLNTIAATITPDPPKAESLVEDLSDMFRASIGRSQRLVPFDDERRLAEGYLNMESLRLGERLTVAQDFVAVPGDALIPPLTLQPLLENAVYYGVEPREDGASLRLSGYLEGNELILTVANPVPPEGWRTRAGFGTALSNVRERLELAFGTQAQLTTREDSGTFRVVLRLPYRRGDEDEDLDRR